MKRYLPICSLLLLSAIIIFINFSNRIVYGPEQGISLLSSAENLTKPSLLGIPYLLRQTHDGLRIFTSPIFGYILLPFILIFKFDPISITYIFPLLTLVTTLVTFLVIKNISNQKIALLASFLYVFNARIIYHSYFIWISNLMPLIGILTYYFLIKFKKVKDNKNLFYIGLLLGSGVALQYFYSLVLIVIVIYLLFYLKIKIFKLFTLTLGILIPLIPTILFDIKHQFYNLKTLFDYFFDIFTQKNESQLSYYHFLFIYPLIAYFVAVLIIKIFKTNKYIILIASIYLFFNINSKLINFDKSVGMPDGLSVKDLINSTKIINDQPKTKFNVSVVGNFDNRGYTLRFPLRYIYRLIPEAVENYSDINTLYVVSYIGYNFDKADIWEVQAFGKANKIEYFKLNEKWNLTKLSK